MTARSGILIVLALLMAAGTFFVMKGYLASQRRPTVVEVVEQQVETQVLVTRTDLPAGSFINEQHLRWQTWPDDDLPENYLLKSTFKQENLFGAVVRRGMPAGTPIVKAHVAKPGDRGFLAAVLRPGYRAFSIKVSAASSISGLVFPGDLIDVILIHKYKSGGSDRKAAETVLQNVRVLALDQTIDDQNGTPRVAKTATFEVTPKQAEILALAGDLGRITLSLRSLAKDEEEMRRIVESGEPLKDPLPTRARTYTRDSEASVLVGFGGGPQVQVSRGAKVSKAGASK